MGTAEAQWLRCCATIRKVAGSIPAVVIGIFHLHNPSDRTMALGSIEFVMPYHIPHHFKNKLHPSQYGFPKANLQQLN